MTKLKAAAASRKTKLTGAWLTVATAGLAALSLHWAALQSVMAPGWWVTGAVAIAVATAALAHVREDG